MSTLLQNYVSPGFGSNFRAFPAPELKMQFYNLRASVVFGVGGNPLFWSDSTLHLYGGIWDLHLNFQPAQKEHDGYHSGEHTAVSVWHAYRCRNIMLIPDSVVGTYLICRLTAETETNTENHIPCMKTKANSSRVSNYMGWVGNLCINLRFQLS